MNIKVKKHFSGKWVVLLTPPNGYRYSAQLVDTFEEARRCCWRVLSATR
jgi:hypothetical protein